MNLMVGAKPMAKKRGRPPKSTRDDVAVKVDAAIVAKAKYVANIRKITLAEYLSETLKIPVEKDFVKGSQKASGEQKT